jgi:biopolymer transport protein ExbB
MPSMGFDLWHVIKLGWPVLSVLLAFSVVTVAVFLEGTSLVKRLERIAAGHAAPEEATASGFFLERMDQRLAMLGTIANAAPFVGLLGTVIGIIRAFHTISQASGAGGGMALVAGGISEALVSTAAGLAVAIPASMIYNYFTFHQERLAKRLGGQ